MFPPANNNQQQQQQQQQQPTDLVSSLKDWWHTCPLFTRFTFFVCSGLCIMAIFSAGKLPAMLVNKPSLTVGQFQITRLIFSPFVFYSIIQAIFAFVTYLPVAAQQEKENGTLKTIIDFFLKNLEISIIFVVLCYIMSHLSKWFLTLEAYGLWAILFLQIVERCLVYPEETTAFLLPSFRLPNKYYPIVLIVIFSIVTDALRLDMVAAAFAAFVNLRFVNPVYDEKFNHEKVTAWESHSAVAWLKTLPNFVSLASSSGPLIAEQGREYDPNYAPIGATTPSPKKKNSSNSNNLYGDGEIRLGDIKPANKRTEEKNEFGVDI